MTRIPIQTPNGIGFIDKMYISELGFLMVRVLSDNDNRYTTYNLGTHDPKNNYFSNVIIPNRWLYQFIKSDKLWYLSEHHPEDGVMSELFFETEKQLLDYVKENKINLELK